MDATPVPIPPATAKKTKRLWRWISVAILAFICLIGVKWVQAQRQLARNAQCRGKLGQIELALQNYKERFGTLPALAMRDDQGTPLFSWRVLLLPDLDQHVYADLDLSEPWNSPKNVAVAQQASASPVSVARAFHSPNDFGSPNDDASFVAIEIPEGPKSGRRIVVVEIHNTGIHWMEPRDLSRAEIQSRIAEMLDRGESVHILNADGRIGTISGSSLTFFGSADDLFDQWMSPH